MMGFRLWSVRVGNAAANEDVQNIIDAEHLSLAAQEFCFKVCETMQF